MPDPRGRPHAFGQLHHRRVVRGVSPAVEQLDGHLAIEGLVEPGKHGAPRSLPEQLAQLDGPDLHRYLDRLGLGAVPGRQHHRHRLLHTHPENCTRLRIQTGNARAPFHEFPFPR
jgi:hypothetical protein